MNGFEWNKVMAAVLVAVLIASLAGFAARKTIHPEMPTKNSFIVEGVGQEPAAIPVAAPAGPAKIEPLLAKADSAAGQKTARVCGTCHSFGKGEAAKIGPNLYGVVGGPHAHMAGYDYSDAMKAMSSHEWSFDELNEFLYSPREHIPGTKMSFAGIKNDQDRANVIAWLDSNADQPLPLPKK